MPAGVLAFPVPDSTELVEDDSDPTKILKFSIGGFTTATTRTVTWPDASFTVAGLSLANVFTTIQTIRSGADGTIPLLVEGNSVTQSAKLIQARRSTGGAIRFEVDPTGYIMVDDGFGGCVLKESSGNTIFRGIRAASWADGTTATHFQVGSAGGSTVLTTASANAASRFLIDAITCQISDRSYNNVPIPIADTLLELYVYTAQTNTAQTTFLISHESTGTPAAGFGVGMGFRAHSSTTTRQNVADITSSWSVATHATRAGLLTHSVYYTSTSQEGIRLTAASGGVTVTIGNDANYAGLVVNENGNDADFRVEGDTATNLLVCDASADNVDIGTTTQGALARFSPLGITFNNTGADIDFFFEGVTDEKLLCGDAGTDNVGVGVHPPEVKFHVWDHDTNTNTVVRGMILELDSSNTPAVGFGTEMAFRLEDDTAISKDAASIYAAWLDATDTSQRAALVMSAYYITTAQEGFRIEGTKGGCLVKIGNDANYGGLVINEGSANADFRVESNGNTHAIFVDAGADRVGIFNSSPASTLDVTGAVTIGGATAGATALSISSTATNDDPNYIVRQTRVATTDATVTTIDTVTIAASNSYAIEARVVSRRTGGTSGAADDGAFHVRSCLVTTKSSVVTITGTTSVVTQEDQAGWDVTFTVSGSTVLIQVTGAANNNVTWHCTAIIQNVGS